MKVASTELEEYIRSTLASIKKGVHDDGSFRIHGLIEFDLAITNAKEGKGGLKVYVIGAEGKSKSEKISRIKFKVRPYADKEKDKDREASSAHDKAEHKK